MQFWGDVVNGDCRGQSGSSMDHKLTFVASCQLPRYDPLTELFILLKNEFCKICRPFPKISSLQCISMPPALLSCKVTLNSLL